MRVCHSPEINNLPASFAVFARGNDVIPVLEVVAVEVILEAAAVTVGVYSSDSSRMRSSACNGYHSQHTAASLHSASGTSTVPRSVSLPAGRSLGCNCLFVEILACLIHLCRD